jgi:hypothetical protein
LLGGGPQGGICMWSNRIVIGAVIAVIVIAAVDAFRPSDHKTIHRPTTAATTPSTAALPGVRRCARSDLTMVIRLRRPSRQQSRQQTSGLTGAWPRRRVTTIVVRNVAAPRCLLETGGYSLTIKDRSGKMIGEWDDPAWFDDTYAPGSEKTFSLPGVYHCDRPGPFVAVAEVGYYTAQRRNLHRRDITC